jgi:hypothetical protein
MDVQGEGMMVGLPRNTSLHIRREFGVRIIAVLRWVRILWTPSSECSCLEGVRLGPGMREREYVRARGREGTLTELHAGNKHRLCLCSARRNLARRRILICSSARPAKPVRLVVRFRFRLGMSVVLTFLTSASTCSLMS